MLTKGVLLATALAFIGCGLLSFFLANSYFWIYWLWPYKC